MAEARVHAYRRLLFCYLIVSGLLTTGFAVVGMISASKGELGPFVFPVGLAVVALVVCTCVQIARNKPWGAYLAVGNALLLGVVMLISGIAISLEAKPKDREGSVGGSIVLPLFQLFTVLFANRALKSKDDFGLQWAIESPLEHALIAVLGLAAGADGNVTPEKIALAIDAWQTCFGPSISPTFLQEQLLAAATSHDPARALAMARPQLMQRINTEQRAWIFERCCAVAAPDGNPQPLANDFLGELYSKLGLSNSVRASAPSALEPFGSAS